MNGEKRIVLHDADKRIIIFKKPFAHDYTYYSLILVVNATLIEFLIDWFF